MKLNSHFDAQLKELKQSLEDMTARDLECLKTIYEALESGNLEPLSQIRGMSMEIDRAERVIESLCLKILLRRQPVAGDLRHVSSTLKMITDLQRIGHQSCDFAEITLKGGKDLAGHFRVLADMAELVIAMFESAISACVHEDAFSARCVILSDGDVDIAYVLLRTRLSEKIRAGDSPVSDTLLDVLMLGKYLERMADHVVLFARWIVFSATGERPEEESGRLASSSDEA